MKYEVYIDKDNLIFEPKHGKPIAFEFKEISNFTIIKVNNDALVPTMIGGKPYFLTKKNPTLSGTIVIAFNDYYEKEIQKKNYKKIISIYPYFKIKHVNNVYDIGEKLIDLKVHYDSVITKKIKKIDNDGHEFYSYTKTMG